MNALVIDCAVSRLCIAAKKDKIEAKLCLDVGNKQSEKLLPAIDYIMKEVSLEPKDLDYTAVTLGPGTFTGLRLGLSALKAMNLAHGIPVYGIPSLDAYAWPFRKSLESVVSLIEAKEDEFFYAFYLRGEKIKPEEDKEISEIIKQFDAEATILACGPASKVFVERSNELYPLYSVHAFTPENDACDSLFQIAEKMIDNKESPMQDYDGPLYVRKSEAELNLEKNK